MVHVSVAVNGTAVVTTASSSMKVTVSSSNSQVKMSAGIQSTVGSHSTVQLPTGSGNQAQKPVMRVSPMTDGQQHVVSNDGVVFTTGKKADWICVLFTSIHHLTTVKF